MKFPDGWPDQWSNVGHWGGQDDLLKQKRWRREVPCAPYYARSRGRVERYTTEPEYFTTAHCLGCGKVAATMQDGEELRQEWELGPGVGWVDEAAKPVGWMCERGSDLVYGEGECHMLFDTPLACSDACEFKILVDSGIAPEVARAMTGLIDPTGLRAEDVPVDVVERMNTENQRLRKMLAAAGVHVPPELSLKP